MFTGVTDHWTAHKNWSRENLLKVYGDTDFKVILFSTQCNT